MGETHALYDTTFSERGVMLAVSRAPRKPNPFDFQPPLIIKTMGVREDGMSRCGGRRQGWGLFAVIVKDSPYT